MGRSRGRSPAWRRWLSHRRLVTVEAVLVVGLLESLGETWLRARPDIPTWVTLLLLMSLTVGLFGGLFVLLQRTTTRSLATTHQVVQALPLPTPMLLVHTAALLSLVLAWSWAENLPVW